MSDSDSPAVKRGMDFFGLDEDGCGIAFDDFAEAVAIWVSMQPGGRASQRVAAEAFHTTDAVVAEAVKAHYWMFFSGPEDDPTRLMIELDGE